MPTSEGTDEEVEDTYRQIENLLSNIPKREPTLIIGD